MFNVYTYFITKKIFVNPPALNPEKLKVNADLGNPGGNKLKREVF